MRKLPITLALSASISLLAVQTSHAADEVVLEDPNHIWSGFYAGVGIGAGAVVHDVGSLNPPIGGVTSIGFNGLGGEGLFGEITAGYDFVTAGGIVYGVGANARLSNIASTLNVGPILGPFGADITADYGFDVFARAGYLFTPQTLGYVLAGYSVQHFDINATGFGSVYDWSAGGFVVGAGFETALTQRVHLKGEYRYSQYSDEDFSPLLGAPAGSLTVTPSFHTASLGVVYRFGEATQTASLAGAAPVDFTGFYVGGALAATGLTHELSLPPFPLSFNGIGAEGFTGRLQAGYDHELSNGVVVGVQGEFAIGNVATELTATGPGVAFGASIDQEHTWSLIGRLGKKVGPRTMLFALGGYTTEQYDVNVGGLGTLFSFDTQGIVAGGGIETAVTENVFVGLEYRYTQTLEEFPLGLGISLDLEPSSHSGLFTAKYKF